MEPREERPLDEGDVLDVLERDGLLDLEEDSLAKPEHPARDVALELGEVMAGPPRTEAAQPNKCQREANDRRGHRKAEGHDEVGPVLRIEPGHHGVLGPGQRLLHMDGDLHRTIWGCAGRMAHAPQGQRTTRHRRGQGAAIPVVASGGNRGSLRPHGERDDRLAEP